jgi:hypothetical protein
MPSVLKASCRSRSRDGLPHSSTVYGFCPVSTQKKTISHQSSRRLLSLFKESLASPTMTCRYLNQFCVHISMHPCTSKVTINVPVCVADMEAATMFQGVDCRMPLYRIYFTRICGSISTSLAYREATKTHDFAACNSYRSSTLTLIDY